MGIAKITCIDQSAFPARQRRHEVVVDLRRRKTVLSAATVCALPLLATPALSLCGSVSAAPAVDPGDIEAAIAFLQQRHPAPPSVIHQPVSLLQRRLLLGYGRAVRLAAELERIGFWTLHAHPALQRVARLNRWFGRDGRGFPG